MDRDTGFELWKLLIDSLKSANIRKCKRKEIYLALFDFFQNEGWDSFADLLSDSDIGDKAYDDAYRQEFDCD